MRNTVNVVGVRVDAVDTVMLYERITDFVQQKRSYKVMYVNAHCMVISRNDREYREILNNADLVYPDGIGVVLAAKLFGNHLPKRSTAADFMPEFCKGFAKNGFSIYLLGAMPGIAGQAARKLKEVAPELKVTGSHHGYLKPEEKERVINDIVERKPDILLVGMGVPYQEKWIHENFKLLNVPVVWGVGGLFDFLSGRLRRGPKWLLDNGFEWLCRLFIEPGRLWKRYIINNAKFLWFAFRYRFLGGTLE